jgi:lipid-A-disaccharide synthase
MRVLISAAESSSDVHGAQLLAALKKLEPGIEAYGIGGPRLQAEGLRAVVDARELLAMGFIEVLGNLPRTFRALKKITAEAILHRPDVAVVIDYPDFHFRLARRLWKFGIPLVYYIPPKVWVWRKKRIRFLKKTFSKVLCIFPFEEAFYRAEKMDAKYVGNPLLDELPLQMTREQARSNLNYGMGDRLLVLMPGSRRSEISQHLFLMLDAARGAAQELVERGVLAKNQKLKVSLPLPETSDLKEVQARVDQWQAQVKGFVEVDVKVSQGNAAECLAAADLGLIKSGTSTLEAAFMRCPHAVIYKPSRTTAWIFKNLIRYKGPVGLVNLAGGWSPGDPFLVPEILCEGVTVEALKDEILKLILDSGFRKTMLEGFEGLRAKMMQVESPSLCAAKEVMSLLTSRGGRVH